MQGQVWCRKEPRGSGGGKGPEKVPSRKGAERREQGRQVEEREKWTVLRSSEGVVGPEMDQ